MKDIGEKKRIIGVVIILLVCAALTFAILPDDVFQVLQHLRDN